MSSAGGMDVRSEPMFERVIRRAFNINSRQLERLAIFVLAHALVDQALALQLATDEIIRRGGPGLPEAEKARILQRVIVSKIGPRIKRLRKRGILSPETARAAKKINDERNRLLHGKRDFPTLGGKTIFDDDGYHACLSDALDVWLEYARKVKGGSR